MTTQTAPVTIDFIGSMESLAKWVVLQFVYLFAAFALMLAAPVLFTVGMQLVAHYYAASVSTWGVAYFFAAPWFCAAWMVPVCHWYETVERWKARKMGMRLAKVDFAVRAARVGRGVMWMFSALIGSYIAEFAFGYAAHRMGMIPNHLNLYFALAPFAVFAPCELVVLYRMLRKREQDGFVVFPNDIS